MSIRPIPWRREARVESDVELVPLDFLGELGLVINGLETSPGRLPDVCSPSMKGPFLTNQADGKIRSHGLFVLFEEKAFTTLLYLRNIIPERFFLAYRPRPASQGERSSLKKPFCSISRGLPIPAYEVKNYMLR